MAGGAPEALDSSRNVQEMDAYSEQRLSKRLMDHVEEKLQRALSAVTKHLEDFLQNKIHAAHEGLAARIEDVTVANVERAIADTYATRSYIVQKEEEKDKDDVPLAPGTPEQLTTQILTLQKRLEELESLALRVFTSSARDAGAVRKEMGAELRRLDASVHFAMDRLQEQQRILAEDRMRTEQSIEALRAEARSLTLAGQQGKVGGLFGSTAAALLGSTGPGGVPESATGQWWTASGSSVSRLLLPEQNGAMVDEHSATSKFIASARGQDASNEVPATEPISLGEAAPFANQRETVITSEAKRNSAIVLGEWLADAGDRATFTRIAAASGDDAMPLDMTGLSGASGESAAMRA